MPTALSFRAPASCWDRHMQIWSETISCGETIEIRKKKAVIVRLEDCDDVTKGRICYTDGQAGPGLTGWIVRNAWLIDGWQNTVMKGCLETWEVLNEDVFAAGNMKKLVWMSKAASSTWKGASSSQLPPVAIVLLKRKGPLFLLGANRAEVNVTAVMDCGSEHAVDDIA